MLTFDDVLGWDPSAIHQVLQAAVNRAGTLEQLGQRLQTVQRLMQSDWIGASGQAFGDQVREVGQEIAADSKLSQSIVAAVGRAEQDVSRCRAAAQSIRATAQANNLTITPDWQIKVANITGLNTVLERSLLAAQEVFLQSDWLDRLQAEANKADQALASAINASLRKPALIRTNQELGQDSTINQAIKLNLKPNQNISQVTPNQVNQPVDQANQEQQTMQRPHTCRRVSS